MGRFDFDEDNENEPTFSLADFRKWLDKNGVGDEPEIKMESDKAEAPRDEAKEKADFKDKLRKRRKKKD